MHKIASPAPSDTLTAIDLFIAFTIFENVVVRSQRPSSTDSRGIPVNHRDFRALFPSPLSPLWLEFARSLHARAPSSGLDEEMVKIIQSILDSFIRADNPSLLWTTPFLEFQKSCWVDQDTNGFFPKNDYVLNGQGKARTIKVRTLFPSYLRVMHTTAQSIKGLVEYIIP